MNVQDLIAQRLWETYAIETGQAMPPGLADRLARAVIDLFGQKWEEANQ